MTRFDVNRMIEDVKECLNQMYASPGITGYKHGCCEVARIGEYISVQFNYCSTDSVEPQRCLDTYE